uniref:Tyrosine-protein phosphatase 1 n=2 Tax=Plectus sambesii TaxID=2011161 RepID=A0A914W534_9BILA
MEHAVTYCSMADAPSPSEIECFFDGADDSVFDDTEQVSVVPFCSSARRSSRRASTSSVHRSASMATSPVVSNGYRKSTGGPNGYTNGHHTTTNGHHAAPHHQQQQHHHHHPTSPLASNGKTNSSLSSQRSSMASRSSIGSHIQPTAATTNGGSPPRTRGSPPGVSPNCSTDDPLVIIRLRPDSQGRFGFNVKGGADQNYPIIVSRVAPGSAADKCYPKLNEGDQVLMINGRDVSQYTHDQIVRFIRSAREVHTGELTLTVRPNAYAGEEVDEPDFQYVPDTPHVADSVPRSDLLNQSLLLLKDAVESGAAVIQFEQLYRKKPGLTMNDCRLADNVNKNRYRDVLPYDATRVIIQKGGNGDYINASFVNMEIPASGIVNRYIAAQGPLPNTAGDFWHVIWEQLCTTIVMLTTTVERGRVKCHQYWPRPYETQEYNRLQVTCLREKETTHTAYREFSIRDKATKEERRVSQMQYMAWPDHGVPEDPRHFIDFVDEVRKARDGSVEPLLVHCSAGIGRTGVLMMMETAACLIEANEPVYALDIVRTMRDQRAQLIQNASQYKFVCEAILMAYNEGLVKPLAEYHKPR